jgi:hypothetical protein
LVEVALVALVLLVVPLQQILVLPELIAAFPVLVFLLYYPGVVAVAWAQNFARLLLYSQPMEGQAVADMESI